MAIESCLTTSTAVTQLQTTPCAPPSSKVESLERPEPRLTRSDRAASSAARLGRASSLSTVPWEPRFEGRARGGRVFKEAYPLGIPIEAVVCIKTLAPRHLKSSA
eukprot:scaffold97702_cov56-Phaeocystis_antarctica.AAC.1